MPKDVKKESGKGSRLASHNPLLISPREAEEAFLPCFLKPRTPKLSNHVLDATIPWTAPHLLQKTTISSLSLSGYSMKVNEERSASHLKQLGLLFSSPVFFHLLH